jgi:hypothetical protein
MFGIEEKIVKPKIFTYEIEKDLQDSGKRKALVENCESRFNELKKIVHNGAEKSSFEAMNLLLQGYTALKKVITKSIQG